MCKHFQTHTCQPDTDDHLPSQHQEIKAYDHTASVGERHTMNSGVPDYIAQVVCHYVTDQLSSGTSFGLGKATY